jgi:hypothetical protein
MQKIFTVVAFATFLSLEPVALLIATPVQAQSLSQVQEGDYYAPDHTVVQQPTPQELNQAREGDYYAPKKTIVQEPTVQDLQHARQGDYYAPQKSN